MSSSFNQLSNCDNSIWENLCENWNLDSLITRCHAMGALITVDERCAIIPDNTCPNPTEKFGVCA
jgi:hypothetical protein